MIFYQFYKCFVALQLLVSQQANAKLIVMTLHPSSLLTLLLSFGLATIALTILGTVAMPVVPALAFLTQDLAS